MRKKINEAIKIQNSLDHPGRYSHYFNGPRIWQDGWRNKFSRGSAWNICFYIDGDRNRFLDPKKPWWKRSDQKTLNLS